MTGGLLLLSSFSVFTALVPRDALCTVTGKKYWNSEPDDKSTNAGRRCRTSHQAEANPKWSLESQDLSV